MPETKYDTSANALNEAPAANRSNTENAQAAPLQIALGAVEIGADGHIQASRDRAPVRFAFVVKGVHFQAEFDRAADGLLRLEADLGNLHRDVHSPNTHKLVQRLLHTAGKLPGGRIALCDDSSLRLSAEATPPSPHTPVNVVATITALVLGFEPYLELVKTARALQEPERQTRPDSTSPSARKGTS